MNKLQKHKTDLEFSKGGEGKTRRKTGASRVSGANANPLTWTVFNPREGEFDVDLAKFRDGSDETGFVGRPALIYDLAPEIRIWTSNKAKSSIKKRLDFLGKFFCFLSQFEVQWGSTVSRCLDVEVAHGEAFKRFLLEQRFGIGRKQETLRAVEAILNASRRRLIDGLDDAQTRLIWPTIESGNAPKMHRDVNPKALKVIYTAAKRLHDKSVESGLEGNKALEKGYDPRGEIKDPETLESPWENVFNLSVLAHERISTRVLLYRDIDQDDVLQLNQCSLRYFSTPSLALMEQHSPSCRATLASYMLVSFHTGWTDTVGAISVVDEDFEDCEDWYVDRSISSDERNQRQSSVMILAKPHDSDTSSNEVDLKAIRPKTGRLHAALSFKNSRYRPYSVLREQIQRTKHLRHLLRMLRWKYLAKERLRVLRRREIFEIERKLRSPWIYFNNKGKGHEAVGLLGVTEPIAATFKRHLTPAAIQVAQRRGKGHLCEDIERMTAGDVRDGFAAYIYDASGGNPFVTQHLLQHQSMRTTRVYLRQNRQIQNRLRTFRDMCRHFFEAIENGRDVDPTALHMAMSSSGFTDKDHQNLLDFRSRYGMACSNPFEPPTEIAPNHIAGTLCATQRCLLCRHGRLTAEAIPHLARRLAELLELSRSIPAQRFLDSSFEIERQAILIVREETYPELADAFDRELANHRRALTDGRALIFDEVPLGEVASEFKAFTTEGGEVN
ncbi:hypothetical protein [Ruegeria sp. HKCCA6837]|uniref:hypothetical protein n=1 Tax=Ruegeria sp. HKCCA6837 TaxID=2682989 RepID=UPI001488BB01|nr:hypothetical protein [Ruegeria sp. HKCCA6837]